MKAAEKSKAVPRSAKTATPATKGKKVIPNLAPKCETSNMKFGLLFLIITVVLAGSLQADYYKLPNSSDIILPNGREYRIPNGSVLYTNLPLVIPDPMPIPVPIPVPIPDPYPIIIPVPEPYPGPIPVPPKPVPPNHYAT